GRLAVQPTGVEGDGDLDDVEAEPEGEDRRGVEEDEPVDGERVDDQRAQREQDLEEREIGQPDEGDAPLRAVAQMTEGALVLPGRLHRAVRPAVALAPQRAER